MARTGFYGGCFNPPTKAHIELAKKALEECNLDRIIFVPVGDSYQKQGMVKGIHRYNMLQIACEDENNLQVSDFEIKSNKYYKAIDVFEILEEQYKSDEKFYLMGADNLKKISTWKESDKLVNNFNYIILDRESIGARMIIENDELLKNNKERFWIIDNYEYNNCSATDIRKEMKNGKQPKNISSKVYDYIRKNNIYL